MKVNYLSENIEDENKIPENITIRTMQSDLARLKEISKRKPTEISKDLPNKISEVNLKEELNDFYPKKPLEKTAKKTNKKNSFLNFHKKAVPPAQLPTEKSEFSLQDQSLKKNKKDIATSNKAGDKSSDLEKKIKVKKNNNKIILLIILLIILVCAGLVFYNYFILQNKNEEIIFLPEETEKLDKEKIKSIIPKIPFIPDILNPEIPTTQPFIPIEEIFSFGISSDEEFDLITALDNYTETLKEIPEIALIEIKEGDKKIDLEKLIQKINIEIPKKIADGFSKNNYGLIFFDFENENRLAIVTEVNDGDMEKMKKNISQWETAMIDDLKLLFLKTEIGFPSTANFKENIYKEVKIRYMNFSEPNTTIDYAFVDNKLILATSKKSIYKIIGILKK